jgi:tetratricopeptide (TPR) repeat protein
MSGRTDSAAEYTTPYETWTQDGMTALEAGDIEQARACFENALTQRSDLAEAHKNLGRVYHAQGEFSQAEAYYRQAIALDPNYWKAYGNLSNLLHDRRDLNGAVDCVQKALALNPDDAVLHSNLGSYLADMDRWEEAEASFRKSMTLSPEYPGAPYNYGLLLIQRQQWQEGLEQLEKVATNPPEEVRLDVHRHLGEAYLHLKEQQRQSKQAVSPDLTCRFIYHFEKLLALHTQGGPTQVIWPELLYVIHFNLGVAYMDALAYTQACERFQTALALNPLENRAYIHHTLAYAYFYQERYPEAEEYIVRFLTVEPVARQPIFSLLLSMLEKRGRFERKTEIGALLKDVDWETVRNGLLQEALQSDTPSINLLEANSLPTTQEGASERNSVPPERGAPSRRGIAGIALGKDAPHQAASAEETQTPPTKPLIRGFARMALDGALSQVPKSQETQ